MLNTNKHTTCGEQKNGQAVQLWLRALTFFQRPNLIPCQVFVFLFRNCLCTFSCKEFEFHEFSSFLTFFCLCSAWMDQLQVARQRSLQRLAPAAGRVQRRPRPGGVDDWKRTSWNVLGIPYQRQQSWSYHWIHLQLFFLLHTHTHTHTHTRSLARAYTHTHTLDWISVNIKYFCTPLWHCFQDHESYRIEMLRCWIKGCHFNVAQFLYEEGFAWSHLAKVFCWNLLKVFQTFIISRAVNGPLMLG